MTPALLDLLIALAAFRVWHLLAVDSILDGPRSVFYRRFPPDKDWAAYRLGWLTARSGKVATPGDIESAKVSKIGVLVDCPWCSGWWVAGLVVLAVCQWRSVPYPLLVWPAASTAVGALGTVFD